jgi:hypothetical protein
MAMPVLMPVLMIMIMVLTGRAVAACGWRWLPGVLVSGVSSHESGFPPLTWPGPRRYPTISIYANLRRCCNNE